MGVLTRKDPLLQTHYEILGLPQNCSFKEIREAFVTISKKVHPDLNPTNPDCHQSFLKLQEAYSVLSKPEKRQGYDAYLINQRYSAQFYNGVPESSVETNAPFGKTSEWKDETLWSSRDKSKDNYYKHKPYYGINGIKRMPNIFIATGCVVFMIVGAIFHFSVVKKSSSIALDILNNKDQENMIQYLETRKKALASGNCAHLERLSEEWKINTSQK